MKRGNVFHAEVLCGFTWYMDCAGTRSAGLAADLCVLYTVWADRGLLSQNTCSSAWLASISTITEACSALCTSPNKVQSFHCLIFIHCHVVFLVLLLNNKCLSSFLYNYIFYIYIVNLQCVYCCCRQFSKRLACYFQWGRQQLCVAAVPNSAYTSRFHDLFLVYVIPHAAYIGGANENH